MAELISAGEAAAHAGRLSQSLVALSPSPLMADMGKVLLPPNLAEFESQSAAMNAAIAASAVGRRVFVPLSIQSVNEFYSASFMRLPIVAANLSQCLGAHTPGNDINDILLLRDSGWLIFLAGNNQELLDSILMSYRLSEETLLPSIVNMNGVQGFREPVELPNEKKLSNFLQARRRATESKGSVAFNPPVDDYMEFKAQQQKAMDSALSVAEKVCEKWSEKFLRGYSAVEKHLLDDADYAFVVAGFNAATCKEVVSKLRAQGEKVGMLRIRMLRPFPRKTIIESLKNVKKIAVVDESISLGSAGIIHTELAQCYSGIACDFISLGKYLAERDFMEIFHQLEKSSASERMWLL